MNFYGIDMQGYFKAQTVIDASALSWESDDEGRLIYDETTEDIWMANDTQWINASAYSDTPLGSEMWFYMNAAPDGWQISGAVAGDELIAVKGGSTYTTGGQVLGSWTTPAHSHSMSSHYHNVPATVTGSSTGTNRSRRSGGNEIIATHTHTTIAVNSGVASPTSTDVDGTETTYRPESNVGIICTRT